MKGKGEVSYGDVIIVAYQGWQEIYSPGELGFDPDKNDIWLKFGTEVRDDV